MLAKSERLSQKASRYGCAEIDSGFLLEEASSDGVHFFPFDVNSYGISSIYKSTVKCCRFFYKQIKTH